MLILNGSDLVNVLKHFSQNYKSKIEKFIEGEKNRKDIEIELKLEETKEKETNNKMFAIDI